MRVSGTGRGRILVGLAVFGGGLLWSVDQAGDAHALVGWLGRWWPGIVLLVMLTNASSFVTARGTTRRRETWLPAVGIVATAAALLVALAITTGGLRRGGPRIVPTAVCLAGLVVAVPGRGRDESSLSVIQAAAWFRRINVVSTAPALRSIRLRVVMGIADLYLDDATPRKDCEVQLTACLALIRVHTPTDWQVKRLAEVGPNTQIVDAESKHTGTEVTLPVALLGAAATARIVRET